MAKKMKHNISSKHGKGRGATGGTTSITANTKYGSHPSKSIPLTGGSKHK